MDHDGPATAVARRIGERLAERIGHHTYDMWFGEAARLHVDGECVRVDTDSPFVADWIKVHFRDALSVTARETLGEQAQVDLHVDDEPLRPRRNGRTRSNGHGNGHAIGNGHGIGHGHAEGNGHGHGHGLANGIANGEDHANGHANGHAEDLEGSHRRRRSTWRRTRQSVLAGLRRLEDYVVGPCNQLGFSAARRLAAGEAGARVLFVHGECGVGKTHLVQGVAHASTRSPGRNGGEARSRYLTAEQFTNEYINAVRSSTLDEFRRRMRRLDLLAVDDVQFLSNKTATQREFLHTVEALELSGARLALAADDHPLRLGFTPALSSRLAAAMVAKIERPDRGLRIALLGRLAASRGLKLSLAAADAIAGRCSGSVRDLEGALNKLAALKMLNHGDSGDEVGLVLVEQLFKDGGWRPRTPIQVETVIDAVCRRMSIGRSDLMGSGRERRVVAGRGLVAYLARELTTLSFPEIAQSLGRKHHSTIHTAAVRMTAQLAAGERTEVGGAQVLLSDLVDQLRHQILKDARK